MQQEAISTADLYDEFEEQIQSISLQFQSFGARESFSGPAKTIKCFEDNVLIKSVLNTPGEGQVLVVDGGGSLRFALMGDMIAQAAVDNGWAGVIINGAVRDRVELAKMDLGIKALGSNPRKTVKRGGGFSDLSIEIDAVTIRPGAMVYADADGVLVER
ncbi:ribonuclease E activity regulator RraA [Glutamicibacter arilaitensis]|uniref:ribonuclease E activity regulator RraA n=1 Tax=Glutamicibacter arilaitensis TaxID=256701 RepID=UPI003850796A